MKRIHFVVGSVCALSAISCAAESEGEGGGYVLLDSDARQAGVSVEVGDHAVTSALPIAVRSDDRVSLLTAGRETPITVGRGELVFVEGASAHVSHLQIGKQVASDQLHLTGEPSAANELASQLGGKVAEDSAGWKWSASDVFAASSSARVPERLLSAAPVLLSAAPSSPVRAPVVVANAPPRVAVLQQAAVPAVAASPAAVVTPTAATRALFTPVGACSGVAGTWRGRVYSNRHGGYYDFTLHVQSQGGSALRGTVTAETWLGSTDLIEPPSTCDGALHETIQETAAGTVGPDGAMHFNSKTWHVANHACGGDMSGYSLDRFEIPLASGASVARAVVSDDGVWRDGMPVDFTRVSCR